MSVGISIPSGVSMALAGMALTVSSVGGAQISEGSRLDTEREKGYIPSPSVERVPYFDRIDALDSRPWRYAESNRIEILSRCSDETTQRFVRKLESRLRQIAPMFPVPPGDLPLKLFLMSRKPDGGRDSTGVQAQEIKFQSGMGPRPATILMDFSSYELAVQSPERDRRLQEAADAVARRFAILAAGRLGGPMPPRPSQPDLYWLWFGLHHFYVDLRFARDSVHLVWPPSGRRSEVETRLRPRIVAFPLSQTFTRPVMGEDQAAADVWVIKLGLFMRWALLERDGRRRDAFWEFANRARSEAVTESLFKTCFGLSYANVEAELARYLKAQGAELEFPLHIADGTGTGPVLQLREASAREVDAFRTAVDDAMAQQPRM